jgi:ribonuclease P protein component
VRHRLDKNEIIRRSPSISAIFNQGRFKRGRSFDVAFKFGINRQAAFAATKRIRTAVARNRIKRRLREAYRLEKSRFNERVQLVLIGHENVAQMPFDDLRDEMRQTAAKINQFGPDKEGWNDGEES